MGREIAYGRRSTGKQSLELQRAAFRKRGIPEADTYLDTKSGKNADRPELQRALAVLRPGDTLVIWKLDRLGRDLHDLVVIVNGLRERGIELVCITQGIDTKTAVGRFVFHIFAALGEVERELILERTEAGRQAAREKGKLGGRPPKMTSAKLVTLQKLRSEGHTVEYAADALGVSVSACYRHLRTLEAQDV